MRFGRTALSLVAICWLACEATSLVAPLASSSLAPVSDGQACTCPVGHGNAECPMHRSHKTAGHQNDTRVRNSCAPDDIALIGLAAGLGILSRPAALHIDLTPTAFALATTILTTRTELPDSPPPRV